MPRDLPLGNGQLLINFDRAYQLRDLYFPYVGMENHTAGHSFRFGVWADGTLRWLHDNGWERDLRYHADGGATDVMLHHPDLGLRLHVVDVVDYAEDLFVRQITLANERPLARQVRLFFHHDFHISETEVGDTAYYEPERHALIHYKGKRWFLMNACPAPSPAPSEDGKPGEPGESAPPPETIGFTEWATGIKEVGGAEGTWRDADDGRLEGNPIAQGAVDSTGALHLTVPAGGEAACFYWIAVGERFEEITRLNRAVRQYGPRHFIQRTASYWRLWVNKEDFDFDTLPTPLVQLFKRSVYILRTQADNRGGILAANDWDITRFNRDTYSYVWPRDGALAARALDLAGYSTVTRRFFEFCAQVLTHEGYFLHKYNPDGSLGSSWQPWCGNGQKQLPIQEDETGLVLWALWEHFERFRDVDFVESLYERLIVPAARFLAQYRDPRTGLPLPSYDLWEERRGVHAFTTGAVYGGLMAAAAFAEAFGDAGLLATASQAAKEVKDGAGRYLWNEAQQRFVRMLTPRRDGGFDTDPTVDASVYGLWAFGMYSPSDPRIVATMDHVRETLWVQTPVGGLARYQNDYYQQVSQDVAHVPGNPWFVCTLWLAQWLIGMAARPEHLQPAIDLLSWAAERALPSGVLAEQVHPYTGEPLSVSPLTWSHATYVTAVLELLDRRSEMTLCPTCGTPAYMREHGRLRQVHQHYAPA